MLDDRLLLKGKVSDGTSVVLSELPLGNLVQLAGWGDFEAAANNALATHGLTLPSDFRRPVRQDGATVWLIAPDRALVRSDKKFALTSDENLVTLDLSHARVHLALAGSGAAGLLARTVALDFSDHAFGIGGFVQTSMHRVSVLIDRPNADVFGIFIPTTWATSLIDLLARHIH
jgi:methylglutamate dehydrogenase subunit D